jgi:hypothetical protein
VVTRPIRTTPFMELMIAERAVDNPSSTCSAPASGGEPCSRHSLAALVNGSSGYRGEFTHILRQPVKSEYISHLACRRTIPQREFMTKQDKATRLQDVTRVPKRHRAVRKPHRGLPQLELGHLSMSLSMRCGWDFSR